MSQTPEELAALATSELEASKVELTKAKADAEAALKMATDAEVIIASAKAELELRQKANDELTSKVSTLEAELSKAIAESKTASAKAAQMVGNLASSEPVPVASAVEGFKSFEDITAEMKAIKSPEEKAKFWEAHRKVVTTRS
jgi:Xaa-Pro aminopeptidase